jgi:Fe-S oxidoreductase
MAGTFGYEAEHYEVSIKVAELKLFPQLRAQAEVNQKSTVISSGAACRMQIRQGTGVRAVHPIELVADFLNEVSHAQK